MVMGLSGGDAESLLLAPLWVFSALVGSHRRFHPLELEAFWRCMERAALDASNELVHDILISAISERDRLLRDYAADARPIASGLTSVTNVLDRLPSGDAQAVKEMLVEQIAEGVARARGSFGQIISRDDAKVLQLIAVLLEHDLDPSDPWDLLEPV